MYQRFGLRHQTQILNSYFEDTIKNFQIYFWLTFFLSKNTENLVILMASLKTNIKS